MPLLNVSETGSQRLLTELAPNLFRLRIPGGAAHLLNMYVWVEGSAVTLIDTGWQGSGAIIEAALAGIGRTTRDVVRVVLTHFHDDHAGAAAEVAAWGAIEIIAGANDAGCVRGTVSGPVATLTSSERSIHEQPTEAPHGPACRVDREVRDAEVLDFAGGARVIAVPGHTPGSIALFLPTVNAVLTGDAVAELHGEVILGVFNCDRAAARLALAKIAETGAEIAGFGHGNPVLSGASARIAAAQDPFAR